MKIYQYMLFGALLLLLGIWLGSEYLSKPIPKNTDEFPSATVLQRPIPIFNFAMTDHNGQEFTVNNLMRKWTFMFFGYTYCPDVCPIALVDLNDVYHNLDEKGGLIEKKFKVGTQFVFVTVDPQRDTVEELKDYISHFNEAFIGITGKPEAIEDIARQMGVAYRRVPGEDEEGDYLVDHSASFILIDPLGRLRATFSPPHDPKQIADDFRKIRSEYTEECCITSDTESETVIFDFRENKK